MIGLLSCSTAFGPAQQRFGQHSLRHRITPHSHRRSACLNQNAWVLWCCAQHSRRASRAFMGTASAGRCFLHERNGGIIVHSVGTSTD